MKGLDLELLLNRIGSVFKPIEEETPEEESLQAALSAQVRKNEYKGIQGKDRGCPKQNTNPNTDRAESESDSKLIRLILDLKAEIGVLCKAMTTHGITIESAPIKYKEQSAIVKQNGKFAGIAKKRNRSRRSGRQRSLVYDAVYLQMHHLIPKKNPKSKPIQWLWSSGSQRVSAQDQ